MQGGDAAAGLAWVEGACLVRPHSWVELGVVELLRDDEPGGLAAATLKLSPVHRPYVTEEKCSFLFADGMDQAHTLLGDGVLPPQLRIFNWKIWQRSLEHLR